MLGSLIAIALPNLSAQAVQVNGSFDWNSRGIEFLENGERNPFFEDNIFSGSAIFQFEKEPFRKGDVTFTINELNNQMIEPSIQEFDITSATFAENWELISFAFNNSDNTSRGIVDFSNPKDSSKSFFIGPEEPTTLEPSNLKTTFKGKTIPEPSTIFGIMTVFVGAGFTRKHLKKSKKAKSKTA